MTNEQFWDIIEGIQRNSDGDMDRKCDLLDKKLRQLSIDDVRSFEDCFTDVYYRAYSWELWAAAYIIGGGCSDDSFSDFRSTLISMGREVFERALADPQSLADMEYNAETAHYEGYQYVASKIYRSMSGGQAVPRSRSHPAKPSGQDWEESKVATFYPKLAKKYGYKDWPTA